MRPVAVQPERSGVVYLGLCIDTETLRMSQQQQRWQQQQLKILRPRVVCCAMSWTLLPAAR